MTTERYTAPRGLIIDTPKGLAMVMGDETAQVFMVGQIFAPLQHLDLEVIGDAITLHRGYRLLDDSPLLARWVCRGCGEDFPLLTQRAEKSHELHVARKIAEALAREQAAPPARTCANTQCRVTSFDGDRCPACYGAPS